MKQQKFYQTTWFMWLTLIFFAPVGIFILWQSKRFKPKTNKILTGIFTAWFGIVLINANMDHSTSEQLATKASDQNQVVASQNNNTVDTTNAQKDNNTKTDVSTTAETGQGKKQEDAEEIKTDDTNTNDINGNLEVHYINVGQADAILIKEPSGKSMLIDAGNNSDGDLVAAYLSQQGIKALGAVIGTHPHEDHIGGLDHIINTYTIEKIYMPKVVHNTQTYKDVLLAIKDKGLKITSPKAGDSWQLGNAIITVLAPSQDEYEELNNYSIVIKLDYGDTSFIFTGDAEALSEEEILKTGIDLKASVLKVGHHGSSSSTSTPFLDAVNPEHAVISCGIDNKYEHPHHETMEKLQAKNINIYRTDEVGTIIINSDGKNITVDKKASTTKENAPPVQQEKPQDQKESNLEAKPEVKEEPEVQNNLTIENITKTVSKGEQATVTIQGVANQQYDITVYYSSGPSKASGLEPKTANSNGMISWTWKVGTRTKSGTYQITIDGNGKTITTNFEVK